MKSPPKQRGMALIMLVFIVGLAATGYLLHALNPASMRAERDKKTASALAEAKAALIGYAAGVDLTPGTCTTNCPRPGDLPCPDTDNDGEAEGSCGNAAGTTGQSSRLGRLPWITLGLSDLRDGSGERLWYAVSNRYKNNTRYRPLNSDTVATITLRNSAGNIINDATSTTGLSAVVIAPGEALVRQDAQVQVRSDANRNIASHYLDIAFGEDNQNFSDGTTNGFITGSVKAADGSVIVNDRIVAISRDEMLKVMETRVLAEVENSLLDYYCGMGNVNYSTKLCTVPGASFPYPATFVNTGCLGSSSATSTCLEGATTRGRIPAYPTTPWSPTSILRASRNNNWFQMNAWREVVYYAIAPACVTGTVSCNGIGFLTVKNPKLLPENDKRLVLIATGHTLGGQLRRNNSEKINEVNYLEGENYAPLDNVYERLVLPINDKNDRVVNLP
jgi:hypothetical protein